MWPYFELKKHKAKEEKSLVILPEKNFVIFEVWFMVSIGKAADCFNTIN